VDTDDSAMDPEPSGVDQQNRVFSSAPTGELRMFGYIITRQKRGGRNRSLPERRDPVRDRNPEGPARGGTAARSTPSSYAGRASRTAVARVAVRVVPRLAVAGRR
jgi:hypothetical protein